MDYCTYVNILTSWPVFERLPLQEFLQLSQANKRFYADRDALLSAIAQRVSKDQPPLSIFSLGKGAQDFKIDVSLSSACRQRFCESTAVTISIRRSKFALLDNGDLFRFNDDGSGVIMPAAYRRRYVSVANGYNMRLLLLDNGEVHACEGLDTYRDTRRLFPEGRPYMAVSASTHCLSLRDDGCIFGWGDNLFGEAYHAEKVRSVGRRYVGISAGFHFSLGLLDNGDVIGWGLDDFGQATGASAALPIGRRYVSISAGGQFSIGLLDDGHIVAWGRDDCGQVRGAAQVNRKVVDRGRKFVCISAGERHAIGLLDNGEVVGWGYDDNNMASGAQEALLRFGGRRYVLFFRCPTKTKRSAQLTALVGT